MVAETDRRNTFSGISRSRRTPQKVPSRTPPIASATCPHRKPEPLSCSDAADHLGGGAVDEVCGVVRELV